MKRIAFSILIVSLLISCQTGEKAKSSSSENNLVNIGKIDSLRSEVLDETRSFWIHVPDEAMGDIFGETTYPVLYLLDGPDHFHAVTGMLRNLGNSGIVPRMVVVGIPNTDRTRDLTPSPVDVVFGDSVFARTSGGGSEFLDFLEKELMPFVEDKYPVTSYRTFVGHSFGGLAALYALYTRPHLFSNYVAIDPSLWWDDWLLVHQAEEHMGKPQLQGKALYIGVANTMEEGMDIKRVLEDTASSSDHIRSILTFLEKADGEKGTVVNLGWKYYPEDDHGSVPLITEYDAFRFLFPWYRLEGLQTFFVPEVEQDAKVLLSALNGHYATVSEHFGYEVLPPEPDVNSLGYNFMNANKPDLAKAMFELNILNYPKSANVYDSMGDYHLAQSDTLQAIKSFSQALELGDNPFTKEKLAQLQADK
jgi:predicted alpha/beta superfamily hydrolase